MVYHLRITVAEDYIGDEYREASPSTGHDGVAANLDVPTAREQMTADYGEEELDERADRLANQKKVDEFVEEVTNSSGQVRNGAIR